MSTKQKVKKKMEIYAILKMKKCNLQLIFSLLQPFFGSATADYYAKLGGRRGEKNEIL